MKLAVRYYSRGGNARKITEAIGVEARTVSEPLDGDVDILFLGSAPCAFDVDDAVKKFIGGIDVSFGKVVNFSTATAVKSTRKYVAKLPAERGIPLAEEEFACRGAFAMLHRGRPDERDQTAAAAFARKITS